MSDGASRVLLRAALIVWCTALVAGTGWLWLRDRSHRWEKPRWNAADFVRVREDVPFAGADEIRLVAVHPHCPHCRTQVAFALAHRGDPSRVRIGALIVDTPRPPQSTLLSGSGVDGVWWDASGRWRARWGHRIYGEVIVFDRTGRLVTTLPPGTAGDPRSGFRSDTSPAPTSK
jgi:hypothetical protein